MTENIEATFTRQMGLFDPRNQKFNLHIFGVGSVGSFLALNLAKLGFSEITAYDFDKVSIENIPNQFYKISNIGQFKVDALKDIIKEFADIDIIPVNVELNESNANEILSSRLSINSLIILAFDNLEARRLIFNQVKGLPNKLIDIRAGGLGYSIQVVELSSEEECKDYEESLNKETVDLPCGMQSIIFTLSSIASEVSQIIVQMNNGEPYRRLLKREMSSYMFIGK